MKSQLSHVMLRHHKKDEDKKSLEASFANANYFREVAVGYLRKKHQLLSSKQRSTSSYELPAWSEMQADSNGALRTIEEILSDVFNVKIEGASDDGS